MAKKANMAQKAKVAKMAFLLLRLGLLFSPKSSKLCFLKTVTYFQNQELPTSHNSASVSISPI